MLSFLPSLRDRTRMTNYIRTQIWCIIAESNILDVILVNHADDVCFFLLPCCAHNFFLNNSVLTFWVACSPFWTILCCSTMLLIRSSHISIFCSGCCGNFLQRPAAVHLRSNSYRPTSYSCAHCKLWCFQGKGQNCLFPALLVILYNGCIFLKLVWTYLGM